MKDILIPSVWFGGRTANLVKQDTCRKIGFEEGSACLICIPFYSIELKNSRTSLLRL